MGLLYKAEEELNISVMITAVNGVIEFEFSADCGKHHTEEVIAGFSLTPKRLLAILSERKDISDDELEDVIHTAGSPRMFVVGDARLLTASVLAAAKPYQILPNLEEMTAVEIINDNHARYDMNVMIIKNQYAGLPDLVCSDKSETKTKGHLRPYKYHK